jgi:NADPH-dependent 2,4-dienoyl-CoA reductase/sulfur reductase-like enzyme/nitrite reductase/ring-hydroxylating ferredoxin subunit
MSAPDDKTPPDLSLGIPSGDLVEGKPLVGKLADDLVLLVRERGRAFAVGASCTHYGGALARGVVAHGQICCPLHHARFALATGETTRAPALNPLACWNVEEVEGKIHLRGQRPAVTARPTPADSPASVVIVGGGAAGHAAAETLRQEGYTGPVTLVSADQSEPYDRPNLSKDYLAGTAPEEWIPLRPADHYRNLDINLLVDTPAVKVHVDSRSVELGDGRSLPFAALLLATGTQPISLDVPGADGPSVLCLRTWADSKKIREAARVARDAVVLGASFIGLEVAAALRTLGIRVTVVTPAARPMGRLFGPAVADFIRRLHEQHGVMFRFGSSPRRIGHKTVTLSSGENVPADLVIVGIGVGPVTDLAQQAGLEVDDGILVNDQLETSAPGIFAAGDVARFPHPVSGERIRIEHWAVAQRQGALAAQNMLGREKRLAIVPFFWSQHYDVTLRYVGYAADWDELRVDGTIDGLDARIDYLAAGKRLAVATINRDRESLEAELAFERQWADATSQ